MGNFSRDSFKETNILTNLLDLAAPVAKPRQYVGVRLQQGVPILDADWNELEDLRRMELMALVRFFIGSGVPAGTQGFQIQVSATANNFNIAPGVILLEGVLVVGSGITSYTTQPNATGLPPLNTPGLDRTDLVYLDAWEDETDADALQGDPRLINVLIGIETAVRIERKWVVRVQENATKLAAVAKVAGHKYSELALVKRRNGAASITVDMIFDRRRTGLTLADNIKVPVFMQFGIETIDVPRVTLALRGLRTNLFARLQGGQTTFPHQTANALNESVLTIALQDVRQRAQVGEVQCASRNMDNADVLAFMKTLYTAQKDFVVLLQNTGNTNNSAQTTALINNYNKRLDGSAPDAIKGLKPAVDNDDLVAAVVAQEVINNFLAEGTGVVIPGEVKTIFKGALPFQKLQKGAPVDLTFTIRSEVTLPAVDTEEFNIEVLMSPSSWTAVPDRTSITLNNQGGEGNVVVRVTPNEPDNQSALTLRARSVRNGALVSTQPPMNLQVNEFPPAASFLFYAGQPLNAQGRLDLPKASLTINLGIPVAFSLLNSSPAQTRTYEVSPTVANFDGVDNPAGWTPAGGVPKTIMNIAPNLPPQPFDVRIKAPPAVQTNRSGTLSLVGKLTKIDNVAVADGESVTVQLPFTVV